MLIRIILKQQQNMFCKKICILVIIRSSDEKRPKEITNKEYFNLGTLTLLATSQAVSKHHLLLSLKYDP